MDNEAKSPHEANHWIESGWGDILNGTAIIVGGIAGNAIGNSGGQSTYDSLSQNAKNMYQKYEKDGWKGNVSGQTNGTKAGGIYQNRDGKLPAVGSDGNQIIYKEFDVNNKIPGQARDMERFIVGSDGSKYYTNNHYGTFIKIE